MRAAEFVPEPEHKLQQAFVGLLDAAFLELLGILLHLVLKSCHIPSTKESMRRLGKKSALRQFV